MGGGGDDDDDDGDGDVGETCLWPEPIRRVSSGRLLPAAVLAENTRCGGAEIVDLDFLLLADRWCWQTCVCVCACALVCFSRARRLHQINPQRAACF